MKILAQHLPYSLAESPTNWHQVDSILTWWVGWRYENGEVKVYGNEKEGVIYV
ncbi:MAG: hypothetical protein AB8G86_19075 [Saprospiraceae bacterium]